jgi:signal peptidase I
MVYIIVMDTLPTKAETKNVSAPLWELAKTLALAIAAWVIICIVLQTAKPMNVVTSCSMLPVLHRGDLVFLQGGQINAPTAQITSSIKAADVSYVNCTVNYFNGSKAVTPCVSSIRAGSVDYPARTRNDVLIYDAEPAAYGAIIHRSVLWLAAGNQSFLLTKGDNNPGLDQQSGISPVTADRINGKVILTVPAIGYLKVFLFAGFDFILRLPTGDLAYAMSAFDAPAGCNYVLSRN